MTDPTRSNPKVRLALIPFLSVIGTAAAVYLSKHYYDLRHGTAGFKSLCNISDTMNCDAVTSSRFAELVPGLPLSSLVAGWFLALFILGLFARLSDWRRETILVGTVMTGFASLYSLGLLVVMTALLHKFCLFCLVIDGVSFTLFAIFLSLLPKSAGNSIFGGAQRSKIQTSALIVFGAVFVMVVILRPSIENQQEQMRSEVDYAVKQTLERAPVEVKTPAGASVLGNPNAPITIHEFSDFQCPFCRKGAVLMNQILARHDGKVKVVFMPFPLDNACNRMITRPMHAHACALARSAFCAGKSGKFRSVYEKIFEDQEFLNAESAKKIPAEFGISPEATSACLDSDEAKKAISESIEEGIRLKVESTPTFFINGKKLDLPLPLEAWDQLISNAK